MPYTSDNTKPVFQNFSSILCIILLHDINNAEYFYKTSATFFFMTHT